MDGGVILSERVVDPRLERATLPAPTAEGERLLERVQRARREVDAEHMVPVAVHLGAAEMTVLRAIWPSVDEPAYTPLLFGMYVRPHQDAEHLSIESRLPIGYE